MSKEEMWTTASIKVDKDNPLETVTPAGVLSEWQFHVSALDKRSS